MPLHVLLEKEKEYFDIGALNKANAVRILIRSIRGNSKPSCFGSKCISLNALEKCAWRFDCSNKF